MMALSPGSEAGPGRRRFPEENDRGAMDRPLISRILDRLDPVLWVVTAAADASRGGLIATFVTPASIVPGIPRVVVGLAKQHETWRIIEASGAFALHPIDEAQLDWVERFGLQSGRDCRDKFAGLSVQVGQTGAPILNDAPACLECRVEERFDTGDRTLYLAAVVAGEQRSEAPWLRLHRMLERADPDLKRRLRDQMDRDILIDSEAIRAWRGPCEGSSRMPFEEAREDGINEDVSRGDAGDVERGRRKQ